ARSCSGCRRAPLPVQEHVPLGFRAICARVNVEPTSCARSGGSMTNTEVGATITAALDLDPPPIALAFVQQPPIGIDTVRVDFPSSCSFWRRAEQQLFYVPAEAHFNCPVGAMVMGSELPQPVANELQQLLTSMCDRGD